MAYGKRIFCALFYPTLIKIPHSSKNNPLYASITLAIFIKLINGDVYFFTQLTAGKIADIQCNVGIYDVIIVERFQRAFFIRAKRPRTQQILEYAIRENQRRIINAPLHRNPDLVFYGAFLAFKCFPYLPYFLHYTGGRHFECGILLFQEQSSTPTLVVK